MYITVSTSTLDDSVALRVNPNSFAGLPAADCKRLAGETVAVQGLPLVVDDLLVDPGVQLGRMTRCHGSWFAEDLAVGQDPELTIGEDFHLPLGTVLQSLSMTLVQPEDGVLVPGQRVILALVADDIPPIDRVGLGLEPGPDRGPEDWEWLVDDLDGSWVQEDDSLEFMVPDDLPPKDLGTHLVIDARHWEQPDCQAFHCQISGDRYAGVPVSW
jgi:hypothetical protein